MRTTLLLLIPLLLGSPIRAQGAESAEPASLARAFGVFDSYGIAEADGPPLAVGPDYRARFEPGRVTFTPALGTRATRSLPLAWSLVAVERDGGTLAADPHAEPQVDGDAVTFAHGAGLLERYDARRDGIEQSFVLPVLPAGSGDLVVRLAIATELPGEPVLEGHGGARFALPDVGGVSIGAVAGIDAGGASAPGTMLVGDGSLKLVLPAEFVDRARLPLVVDPLVGTWFPVADEDAHNDTLPDVAYDRDTDTFLAVWQRGFSGSDFDIRGRRFDAAGNPLGVVMQFAIDDALDALAPKIANVNVRDRWIVIWRERTDSLDPAELVGRSVTAAPIGAGTLGPATTIASPAAGVVDADVGGERRDQHDDVVVVWEQDDYGIRAREVQVADDGTLTKFAVKDVAVNSGVDDWKEPAISRCGGDSGRFLVVFRNGGSPSEISARVLNASATPIGAQRDDIAPPSSHFMTGYEVDGDGEFFGVVWAQLEDDSVLNGAIVGRQVRFHDGELEPGPFVTINDDPGEHENYPVIAFTGDHFVAAWIDETAAFPVDPFSPHAIALDAFTLGPCGPESAVAFSTGFDLSPAIVGRYAGGDDPLEGALPDAMLVWSNRDALSDQGDVRAMSFETLTDVDELAPSCGGGVAYASGAFQGNPDFALRLLEAPPFTLTFLAISFAANPITCGPCTIVPDLLQPSTMLVVTATDALGGAVFPAPLPVGIPDLTAYAQWALLGGTACDLVVGVDLSSGISFDLVSP
jgi:hypothetical protein